MRRGFLEGWDLLSGRSENCAQKNLVLIFNNNDTKLSQTKKNNRGYPSEYPIGYFKSPIGDISYNLGPGIGSLTLLYLTQKSPIPNWVYYLQLGTICPNGLFSVSCIIKQYQTGVTP